MGLARDAVAACLLGGRLYAVGGYDGQAYLERVEAYDTVADEWVQVCDVVLYDFYLNRQGKMYLCFHVDKGNHHRLFAFIE